jgi:predicted 3-demethylubiquinone-9 3-methyltransferase (glyoxalase superfamily)
MAGSSGGNMRDIITHLWFDKQAEDAVNFYVSVFKDSKINEITHYTEAGEKVHKMPAGLVMTIDFELNGQKFLALNGGPIFRFTEAVSLVVPCDSQEEIDEYWEKLSAGGEKSAQQCGWLKDKYGLSWQIVPADMNEIMKDLNKSEKAMAAFINMKKIDVAALKAA